MSGWEVGDLALCVDSTPRYDGHRVLVEQGKVYRVTELALIDYGTATALLLEGVIGWLPGEEKQWPYRATRFRKIRPDQHEDCEPEFVTLLQRIKRKVDA